MRSGPVFFQGSKSQARPNSMFTHSPVSARAPSSSSAAAAVATRAAGTGETVIRSVGHLFDGMSQQSEAARSKRKTADGIPDRLSALPEGLLLYLLSFLPSRDAVRTCVLARRWRNLWKEVPALRITPATTSVYSSPSALNKFVNYLLFFRNRLPLHVAELNSYQGGDFREAVQYLELWIRYSLSCPVAKLSVTIKYRRWSLPKGLITSHLTTLELTRVDTMEDLDFSSSASLKDLKMVDCGIYCDQIISPSLKRLSIMQCLFFENARIRISVPNLILLLLVDCDGRTPLLVSMPYLVEAFVRLGDCFDSCDHSCEIGDCGDGSCLGCTYYENNNGNKNCVFLHGLSSCTNLELTAAARTFIFRKDLTRCPVFGNLKTLLLNEWCITENLGALICFLQHSPVLEKLIIQFDPPEIHERVVEIGASYDLRKQPVVLKDLTVEVKCDDGDERIHKVLDVLCSYGLLPEKIKIQRPPKLTRAQSDDTWTSRSFSFEQET